MNRLERTLFYPVAIIATILTLQAWTMQSPWLSISFIPIVALLWLNPFLPVRTAPIVRIALWLSMMGIVIGGLWLLTWYLAA